jgi:D-tyrosyl-tRNA(Tyr) deacylase
MRALLQRVASASVVVEGQTVGAIGQGLLILLGIRCGDGRKEVSFVADKCVNLRVFEDEQGKMNRSLLDIGGAALVVSQFTLYGETRKGRRPSFVQAAPPGESEPLYGCFVDALREHGIPVQTGVFGAKMQVNLVNDGPVTVVVEKEHG